MSPSRKSGCAEMRSAYFSASSFKAGSVTADSTKICSGSFVGHVFNVPDSEADAEIAFEEMLSKITCAFVPLKPNALTAASLGSEP